MYPTVNHEFAAKLHRVRKLLAVEDLDGLLFCRRDNFAWLTCGGDNHLLRSTDTGSCGLLVTLQAAYVIASGLDAARIRNEELQRAPELEMVEYSRTEISLQQAAADLLHPGASLGSDIPLPVSRNVYGEVSRLRWELTSEECERYRILGAEAGQTLMDVSGHIKPGKTELSIAARCSGHFISLGIEPILLLVGADERMDRYSHPIPTRNVVKERVRITVCVRRHGLMASLTRTVCFSREPGALQDRQVTAAHIDAALMAASRPGKTLGDAFRSGITLLTVQDGREDAWKEAEWGGPTGYAWREVEAQPSSQEIICSPQAFAWSPSFQGARSEDTILVTKMGPEILTASPGWPTLPVEVEGITLERPGVMFL